MGREATLTLSCSSRLKLRASWSWTSSSGPQDGGWRRESMRGRAGEVGARVTGREAGQKGQRARAEQDQEEGDAGSPKPIRWAEKEGSCMPDCQSAGQLPRRKAKDGGWTRTERDSRSRERSGWSVRRRGMRTGWQNRSGPHPPPHPVPWSSPSTVPCTWSASSLLIARASWSCNSSSPLLCGHACSASGGGPEPTAAEEAGNRKKQMDQKPKNGDPQPDGAAAQNPAQIPFPPMASEGQTGKVMEPESKEAQRPAPPSKQQAAAKG